ncbi:MAG: hypothetical protein U5R31_12615 [Acidimicrobiia bacterium]|nr:hypothetical protein [Acidimicrobiia bacterium]
MQNDRSARPGDSGGQTLDVLWVSTVADDELHPALAIERAAGPPSFRAFDPDESRPVHGTLTVDVRGRRPRPRAARAPAADQGRPVGHRSRRLDPASAAHGGS